MSPEYGYLNRNEAARQAMARLRAGGALASYSGGMETPSVKILPLTFQETTPAVQIAQVGVSDDPPYFQTFRSQPHLFESVSVDGYAERGGASESWSTLRAGAGNINDDSGNLLIVHVISTGTTDKWQGIRRSFLLFKIDWEILGDPTIISAALTIVPATITQEFGGKLVVCEVAPASNTAIAASDYLNVSDTVLSDYIDISNLVSGAPARFTLNSTGRELIETQHADDGVAKLGIRLDWDLDDNEPTWVASKTDLVSFSSAEHTSLYPKLDLIWSVEE